MRDIAKQIQLHLYVSRIVPHKHTLQYVDLFACITKIPYKFPSPLSWLTSIKLDKESCLQKITDRLMPEKLDLWDGPILCQHEIKLTQ